MSASFFFSFWSAFKIFPNTGKLTKNVYTGSSEQPCLKWSLWTQGKASLLFFSPASLLHSLVVHQEGCRDVSSLSSQNPFSNDLPMSIFNLCLYNSTQATGIIK
jgi:hypothetical protein